MRLSSLRRRLAALARDLRRSDGPADVLFCATTNQYQLFRQWRKEGILALEGREISNSFLERECLLFGRHWRARLILRLVFAADLICKRIL